MLVSSVCNLLVDQVLLLGLDSLVGGLLIGPLPQRWRDRVGLAVLFGVCDGAGSFVGGTLPHAFPEIPDILLYGVAVVLVGLAARHSRHWLLASPFILALDNLATGAPATAVPTLAVSSGMLALAGMTASAYLSFAAQGFYRRVVALRMDFTKG